MRKKCLYCVNFTEYYLMQNYNFAMTGYGNCKVKKQRVSRHGTCADHKQKPDRKINYHCVMEELENTLTKLNGIKLILDEYGKQTEIKELTNET